MLTSFSKYGVNSLPLFPPSKEYDKFLQALAKHSLKVMMTTSDLEERP